MSFSVRQFGALFACCWLAGCADERPTSILLVTLDTTRADALSCMGGPDGLTPHLDRLAEESLRYERAHTVAPLTLPSHASLLTGLYPPRHTLRDNSIGRLPDEAWTVAEALAARGYDTAAFVAALVLDEVFGLGQGFALYQGPPRTETKASSHFPELDAKTIVDHAVAHLETICAQDPERPFFLWAHVFDAHYPYAPPADFLAAHPNPYFGEIRALDHELGRLFEALRRLGRDDDTLIVIAADHGESLGEHGEETHGAHCWQSTLRIPLLLRYPDRFRAGAISHEVVSLVDLHPTLLEAGGVDAAQRNVDGISLYRRDVPAERGVYFESYTGYLSYGWSPLSGWLDARGKYLHSSEPLFFDPWADPREEQDLSRERADELARYRDAIASTADRTALPASTTPVGGDMVAAIRALGYASGGSVPDLPHPLDTGDAPAPHKRIQQDRQALRIQELNNAGNYVQAESQARLLLKTNANNWFVLDQLSLALMRMQLPDEAIEPLERLVQSGPPWSHVPFRLANCYADTGRFEDALPHFARAYELDPRNEEFRRRFAACLRRLGRNAEADALTGP